MNSTGFEFVNVLSHVLFSVLELTESKLTQFLQYYAY